MNFSDYDFELDRVVQYIGTAHLVALQFPEGLMKFSQQIASTLEERTGATCIIFADVVYGACNYDPVASELLGVERYVHFGHTQIVRQDGPVQPLFIDCNLSLQLTNQAELIE